MYFYLKKRKTQTDNVWDEVNFSFQFYLLPLGVALICLRMGRRPMGSEERILTPCPKHGREGACECVGCAGLSYEPRLERPSVCCGSQLSPWPLDARAAIASMYACAAGGIPSAGTSDARTEIGRGRGVRTEPRGTR